MADLIERPHSIYAGIETFCEPCKRLAIAPIDLREHDGVIHGSSDFIHLYSSLASFFHSVRKGCALCYQIFKQLAVYMKLDMHAYEDSRSETDSTPFSLTAYHTWHGIGHDVGLMVGTGAMCPLQASLVTANINRGYWKSKTESSTKETLKSTKSVDLARWLRRCLAEHSCEKNTQPGYLPPRLMYCGKKSIRLIKSSDLQGLERETRYVTLSYRWGTSPAPLKLSTDNIEQFRTGLPVDSLPTTFKDAVDITRRLGYQYLWVDALCIVQTGDNLADWLHHIDQMHVIYGSCVLNIAATYGKTANDGCYSRRPEGAAYLPLLPPLEFSSLQEVLLEEQSQQPFLVLNYGQWPEETELSSRGWVFQERLMAPRTVHFAEHDVYWECHGTSCSGSLPDGPGSITAPYLLQPRKRPNFDWRAEKTSEFWNWQRLVAKYSQTAVTIAEDRLLAFSAISQKICEQIDDDCIAGFPSSFLPRALLWVKSEENRYGFEKPKDNFWAESFLTQTGIPTWSWGSSLTKVVSSSYMVNCALRAYSGEDMKCRDDNRNVIIATIISKEANLLDLSNKYGPIKDATITLHCPTFKLLRRSESVLTLPSCFGTDEIIFSRSGKSKAYSNWSAEDKPREFFFRADRSQKFDDFVVWKNLICLVISEGSDGYHNICKGIVVAPLATVGCTGQKYVRIGGFRVDQRINDEQEEKFEDWISRMDMKEITIV